MEVIKTQEGSVAILKPMGPLVAGEIDPLDAAFHQLLRQWTKRTVLDMEEVTFLDSAGLELLTQAQRNLHDKGLVLKLCHLNDISQKIVDLTKVSRRFEIYDDTVEAVRSFL